MIGLCKRSTKHGVSVSAFLPLMTEASGAVRGKAFIPGYCSHALVTMLRVVFGLSGYLNFMHDFSAKLT